jgi:hypothetical protein
VSVNRENVIWQSADGSWNRGFYEFHNVGDDQEDWDYEWGVEYDRDEFNWVSTGHPSEQTARDSWSGSNPGGSEVVAYTAESAEYSAELDAMAEKLKQEQRQTAERIQQSSPSRGFD